MGHSFQTDEIITKSLSETQQFAKDFVRKLSGGTVLLLFGDLGAGKTTFTQGLAKGLGINKRIMSPTFIIMRTYSLNNGNIKHFYHVDLYRLQSEQEIIDLGLPELMANPAAITVIEWSEKLGSLKPKNAWQLQFTYLSETERRITITYDN